MLLHERIPFSRVCQILDTLPPSRYYEEVMAHTNRKIISRLELASSSPVRDPLWKHIYLEPGYERILHSTEMQVLSGIRQLGPAHLLYPGAVHTRLSHSIGVYHLARAVITTLLKQDGFTTCTFEGVKAFLTASLLHDLGHFPYAHSLKELPVKDHEVLAGEIITSSRELRDIISQEIGTDPEMVADIIDESRSSENREVQTYRSLLSGPLDPDKLDYLNRDAYFCGVPYGVQDVDYIISKLCWVPEDGLPGIESSGLGALENLLFSKYLMYRYVYWHKTVRSATAMVKQALFEALKEGAISPEDLYQLDDPSFFHLAEDIHIPSAHLITDVRARRLHRCIAEVPFRPDHPAHRNLLDLENRMRMQQSFPCGSVIIDIPEPITLKLSIPLRTPPGEPLPSHIFTAEVVSSMERSLRTVRVFTDPREEVSMEHIYELIGLPEEETHGA